MIDVAIFISPLGCVFFAFDWQGVDGVQRGILGVGRVEKSRFYEERSENDETESAEMTALLVVESYFVNF